jgi:HK97 gp10 family phage protein
MAVSRTRLKGEAELIRRIEALPARFAAVLDTVEPAADPVRRDAGSKAPARTVAGRRKFERLRDSMRVEVRKRTATFIDVRVGPSKDAPHGLWVELGHQIKRDRNGAVLGSVPPHPFLTPAWTIGKAQIRKRIRDEFKKLIDSVR